MVWSTYLATFLKFERIVLLMKSCHLFLTGYKQCLESLGFGTNPVQQSRISEAQNRSYVRSFCFCFFPYIWLLKLHFFFTNIILWVLLMFLVAYSPTLPLYVPLMSLTAAHPWVLLTPSLAAQSWPWGSH